MRNMKISRYNALNRYKYIWLKADHTKEKKFKWRDWLSVCIAVFAFLISVMTFLFDRFPYHKLLYVVTLPDFVMNYNEGNDKRIQVHNDLVVFNQGNRTSVLVRADGYFMSENINDARGKSTEICERVNNPPSNSIKLDSVEAKSYAGVVESGKIISSKLQFSLFKKDAPPDERKTGVICIELVFADVSGRPSRINRPIALVDAIIGKDSTDIKFDLIESYGMQTGPEKAYEKYM